MKDNELGLGRIEAILGRYEYVKNGSNKFYEVMYVGHDLNDQPLFDITWGRIGAKKPQGMRVGYSQASAKLDEKRRKGYTLVPGSFKSVTEKRRVGLQAVVEGVRGKAEAEVAKSKPAQKALPRM